MTHHYSLGTIFVLMLFLSLLIDHSEFRKTVLSLTEIPRYELMEDPNQAIEWLMQLISVVPTDSRALSKLGELYDSEGDKSQAFQYYYEVGG